MLKGTVIKGDGLGKTFGYPTANIDVPRIKVLFRAGIYAAHATLRKKEYKCALVIRDNPWRVEAYLIDYKSNDFYGAKITVHPFQKISTIESAYSKEELRKKISGDIKIVKDYFTEKEK